MQSGSQRCPLPLGEGWGEGYKEPDSRNRGTTWRWFRLLRQPPCRAPSTDSRRVSIPISTRPVSCSKSYSMSNGVKRCQLTNCISTHLRSNLKSCQMSRFTTGHYSGLYLSDKVCDDGSLKSWPTVKIPGHHPRFPAPVIWPMHSVA